MSFLAQELRFSFYKPYRLEIAYFSQMNLKCNNLDHIKSLQALHCRAAGLIYNLPRDTPSKTVMGATNWVSIYDMYKINLVKLFYNIVSDNTPPLIQI